VRCWNCNHDNQDGNQFCGMCGHQLGQSAAGPELVIAKVLEPLDLEWKPRAPSQQIWGNPQPEPESQTPHPSEPVKAVPPPGPAHSGEEAPGDEQKTIVSGPYRSELVLPQAIAPAPSFLGLSSDDDSSGGAHSYLFQEEEEGSQKELWVFLIVLLAVGGVLYAKWQPIRDYVLTATQTHARLQQRPRQKNATDDQPTTPPSFAPTTTLATRDTPLQPTIITDNPSQTQSADQNKAADKADKKEGFPGGEKSTATKDQAAAAKPDGNGDTSADWGRSENARSKFSAKSQPSKQASPKEMNKKSAADDGPSPKKAARAPRPQSNPASELVTRGEKYLYGRGVVRNCDQAVSYLNAAAMKQNPQAFSQLGALYATGHCVRMDRGIAYAWFRLAYRREPTNQYFEQNMRILWREMSPAERHSVMEKQ